ncbi:MAG: iron ABC transporter permease [Treponema sp.]|jgi:iron complex transport system permease protein|nr:iron ABC transporter permease [Treponema sp.]
MTTRITGINVLAFAALCAVSLYSLLVGTAHIKLYDLWRGVLFLLTGEGDETASIVLFQIRLPRLVLAVACGASLGAAGAGFQAVFRNVLADPFVIGSSSGAALGAGIAMLIAFPAPVAAFAGSLSAVLLAWSIAGRRQSVALLLAGTSISSLFSSILSILLIIKDGSLQRVHYWLLGSLASASWQTTLPLLPAMAVGCTALFLCSRALDIIVQDDETALSLGLDVRGVKLTVVLGASLATAATVAGAGVIGFAGLAAPHVARLLTGPAHRRLLPLSVLVGGFLVIVSDIVSRIILPPLEIPISVVTSLGGVPFFLYLLSRQEKGGIS